jgi:hypothetical protein
VRGVLAGAMLLLAGSAAGQSGESTTPATAPPAAVQPGAPLDPTGFRYQRALPDGPPDLVVLPLDAAVLAHSHGPQRNFGDVRIADEHGAQIPYVLEPLAAPLTLDLPIAPTSPRVPQLAAPGGKARSFYAIDLPYEELPAPVLTLHTAESIFLRALELGVQRPADRRHKTEWFELLTRTVWQHTDPRAPAPPLEIPLSRRGGRELLLIVEEGDNRPLAMTGAQLLLPGWQLRFFRPAGPLRLLYGHSELTAPKYDIALLAPSAMSGPARSIAAAPEAPVSRPAALLSPRVFWIGLSAAVLVLAGLIVRLISSDTARRPSPPAP